MRGVRTTCLIFNDRDWAERGLRQEFRQYVNEPMKYAKLRHLETNLNVLSQSGGGATRETQKAQEQASYRVRPSPARAGRHGPDAPDIARRRKAARTKKRKIWKHRRDKKQPGSVCTACTPHMFGGRGSHMARVVKNAAHRFPPMPTDAHRCSGACQRAAARRRGRRRCVVLVGRGRGYRGQRRREPLCGEGSELRWVASLRRAAAALPPTPRPLVGTWRNAPTGGSADGAGPARGDGRGEGRAGRKGTHRLRRCSP